MEAPAPPQSPALFKECSDERVRAFSLVLFLGPAAAADAPRHRPLVELFTSQG